MSNQPHKWTQEEIETLRREYGTNGKTQHQLADELGISRYQVSLQVRRMGLQKRPAPAPWTSEEQHLLLELAEKKSVPQIAEIMQRPVHGVTGQLRKLNASRRNRNGWYTLKEVAGIFGMTVMFTRKFVEDGSLKATYHNGERPGRAGGKAWHIEERDLRKFIRRHPQSIQGRNVDMVQLVQILGGIEVPEQEGRKVSQSRGMPKAPTAIGMRTGDGGTAFGMETGREGEPDALMMFREARGRENIWVTTGWVTADELAGMMQEQVTRETTSQGATR